MDQFNGGGSIEVASDLTTTCRVTEQVYLDHILSVHAQHLLRKADDPTQGLGALLARVYGRDLLTLLRERLRNGVGRLAVDPAVPKSRKVLAVIAVPLARTRGILWPRVENRKVSLHGV